VFFPLEKADAVFILLYWMGFSLAGREDVTEDAWPASAQTGEVHSRTLSLSKWEVGHLRSGHPLSLVGFAATIYTPERRWSGLR